MAEIVDHLTIKDRIAGKPPYYYFGYGLESQPAVMDAIVGRSVTAQTGVVAIGRLLAVQEIEAVPDIASPLLGNMSARQILRNTYPDHPFSSYVLLDSLKRDDTVEGTLYELTVEDMAWLYGWDIADPELEEAAWRRLEVVELAPVDGLNVFETLNVGRNSQRVSKIVDGMNYDPYLNGKDVAFRAIKAFVAEEKQRRLQR